MESSTFPSTNPITTQPKSQPSHESSPPKSPLAGIYKVRLTDSTESPEEKTMKPGSGNSQDQAQALALRQGSRCITANPPSQKPLSKAPQPTIATEKVVVDKRYIVRGGKMPENKVENKVENKERVVLATNARPKNRRNFDDCCEKQRLLHDWVKKDGFGLNVENLEYRVYTKNVESKLKAQLDTAEVQQNGQTFKNFANPKNEHYNSWFKNLNSGTVMLCKDRPKTSPPLPPQSDTVPLEFRTEEFQAGVARCIGRRDQMEDNHIVKGFEININQIQYPVQLTGVFDGHGGSQFSAYVKNNIADLLKYLLETFNQDGLSELGIFNALKITMVVLDGQVTADSPKKIKIEGSCDRDGNQKFRYPGTTANVVIILNNKLWTANVGDSRALLVDNKNNKTRQISKDIKPADAGKKAEVRGGFASAKKGVMGAIRMGTAIGDHNYASVSSRPKITRLTTEEYSGKMLVQICDGVTDVASSNEIGQVAAKYIDAGDSPARAAGKLVAQAYAAGSKDNLTCLLTPLPLPA